MWARPEPQPRGGGRARYLQGGRCHRIARCGRSGGPGTAAAAAAATAAAPGRAPPAGPAGTCAGGRDQDPAQCAGSPACRWACLVESRPFLDYVFIRGVASSGREYLHL